MQAQTDGQADPDPLFQYVVLRRDLQEYEGFCVHVSHGNLSMSCSSVCTSRMQMGLYIAILFFAYTSIRTLLVLAVAVLCTPHAPPAPLTLWRRRHQC